MTSFFASAIISLIEKPLPLSGGAIAAPRAQAMPGVERAVRPAAAATLRFSICASGSFPLAELAPELNLLLFVVLHLPSRDG